MTWRDLLDRWSAVEQDLQDLGIDVGDPAIRHGRTWRWGETRILGLLSRPPLGYIRVDEADGKTYRTKPVYGTRVQRALNADAIAIG